MKKVTVLILTIYIGLLFGCSWFTSPKNIPVQQAYVGKILGKRPTSVFSLTPDRRMIIVQVNQDDPEQPAMFCAEPPPDIAENIASSFRAIAEASAKWKGDIDATAAADLSKSLSTTAVSLFQRSQGVQMFRDGLFNLCQAYANGVIKNDDEYWNKYSELLNNASNLISKEIPNVKEMKRAQINMQILNAKSSAESAMQKAEKAADRAEKTVDDIRKKLEEIKHEK